MSYERRQVAPTLRKQPFHIGQIQMPGESLSGGLNPTDVCRILTPDEYPTINNPFVDGTIALSVDIAKDSIGFQDNLYANLIKLLSPFPI